MCFLRSYQLLTIKINSKLVPFHFKFESHNIVFGSIEWHFCFCIQGYQEKNPPTNDLIQILVCALHSQSVLRIETQTLSQYIIPGEGEKHIKLENAIPEEILC